MIFVMVGTQLPFPRLIAAMDEIAADLNEEVVAQTGPYAEITKNLTRFATLTPELFEQYFTSARIIVAHAGVGAILSAKQFEKPLVLLPRRVALNEHRNDHQFATAKQVVGGKGVYVAWETEDIAPLLARTDLVAAGSEMSDNHNALIGRIRNFIQA